MVDEPHPSNERRYARLFALSVGIPLAAMALKVALTPPTHRADKAFFIRKLEQPAAYDVVLAGNSRVYRGLSPTAFTAESGLRAYNFGFSATQLTPEYLDRAVRLLDRNGRRILVLELDPVSFNRVNDEEFTLIERYTSLDRFNLRSFEGLAVRLAPGIPRRSKEKPRRDGFVWTSASKINEGLMARRMANGSEPVIFDPAAFARTMTWVAQAKRRGISVFGLAMPVPDATKEMERAAGYDAEAARRAFEGTGGRWLSVPGAYRTYDGSHLIGDDAERFSGELGRRMRAEIGA